MFVLYNIKIGICLEVQVPVYNVVVVSTRFFGELPVRSEMYYIIATIKK